MNVSSNPLVRARNPFDRRLIGLIEGSKPNHGVGIFARPLPGGISQQLPRVRATTTAAAKPFAVTHVSGDVFRVQAGTCEGQMIPTQTIDVGTDRPVAILAYPQYTLGIDSGQFVNTMAVKTGAYAPALVSSTTTLDDVDSGISSAGTEARALIAYIDTGNVISQITTGNITGTWQDDGSLTGLAAGIFNKNA